MILACQVLHHVWKGTRLSPSLLFIIMQGESLRTRLQQVWWVQWVQRVWYISESMAPESCSVLGTWTVPGERDCRAMYTWLALNYTITWGYWSDSTARCCSHLCQQTCNSYIDSQPNFLNYFQQTYISRIWECWQTLASPQDPTQLFIACSTEMWGEPGIFSHMSMM